LQVFLRGCFNQAEMIVIRKIFLLLIGIAFLNGLHAQVLQPATWEFEVSESEVKQGDEIDLIFKAFIDSKWYLYSSDFELNPGPIPTSFTFQKDASYQLMGDIIPINPSRKIDEIFEGEVSYFKGTGEFRQKVKIIGESPIIKGSFSYQVCSDIDGKCIPFDEDFTFNNIKVIAGENIMPIQTLSLQLPGDETNDQEGKSGILKPASWSFSVSDTAARPNDELDLIFQAKIDDDWYLYSSDVDLVPGPIPATFTFSENETYELLGKIQPVGALSKYDKIFEGDVTYFKGTAEFRQRVKLKKSGFAISGSVEYQVCSDIDGKCIPFEEDFEFGKESKTPVVLNDEKIADSNKSLLKSRDTHSPYSLLSFMLIAFLAGLAALFTPCVFPMIPMTVTFFTGKAKNKKTGIKNAIIYGFSIILIYTIIGSVVAPFMGPEMANELATNWIPNLIFFLVFVVFALSFFGLFEITLPSSWVNKADKQADKGGIAGIFFMAFTLVLVSFSCTGPIVGSILVEAAGGQLLKPILGMFAFAMAFAIPFTLFAIFPEWLNSLPKSGGWLNSVKVVLGFLELAFALKFLSIADQAYHWGILDREVYLAFWIVIFTFLGFYLLGKIRLPHDSPLEVISVPRLILSILVFTFVIFLIPGMFGAPLKALAGYLPPMSTHDFKLAESKNILISGSGTGEKILCDEPKYADFLHFPHGIKGYFDYDQALSCAKEQNKPVFVDFTGHGCVNCREMEARVWSEAAVLQRFNSDFIMLALYVDDKTELPQSAWYTSEYDKKVKKTIGRQNADLQIRQFNNNAQPFYLILDVNGELLVEPKSYDLNVNNFISFLDAGKKAFAEKK
jgi:thiol:disulfide interchange protein